MKNFKKPIRKKMKVTRRSILGLCLLGALTISETTFSQTERAEKWICEYGSGSGGDGEYMRNLKFEHGSWGLAFCTGSTPKMMINYNGHTGVGTTASQLDNLGYDKSFRIHGANSSQMFLSNDNVHIGMFTSDNMGFIGTKSNDHVRFLSNDIERMTITNAGNIGIGTSTPEAFSYGPNLHLNGARRSRLFLESERYGMQAQAYLNSYFSDGQIGYYLGTTTDHKTFLQANNKTGLTVKYDNTSEEAFVGIGTTDPTEALHLGGNIRGNQNGAIRVQTDFGYTDIGSKNANWSHFNTDRDRFYFNKPVYVDSGLVSSYNSDISIATGNDTNTPDTRMTISKTTGNVGIAVAPHATSKLHVDGEVRASNFVSSATSFPDYVFEADYEITPLEEIEAYVKEHKHLPNMPSEQEVVNEGLNMPLIIDRSVENIESIFLHLIEMQKGMKQLENKIKTLEQENKKLKIALNN